MVRYVIMLAYDPRTWEQADAAQQQSFIDAHHAFESYLDAHGERLNSAALCDADVATTVRRSDDGMSVTDGPYAELVEQLAGFYDVRLPDLDTALAAAELLHRHYTIEIRPVMHVEGLSAT